jgi:hypothetical protein
MASRDPSSTSPFRPAAWVVFFAALALGLQGPASAQDSKLNTSNLVTPKQKLDYTRDAISEMQEMLKSGANLLTSAKETEDAEDDKCVNGKLVQIRVLIGVAQSAQDAMKSFLSNNQAGKAQLELKKVMVAHGKAQEFLDQAGECVGINSTTEGDFDMDIEGDEDEELSEEDIFEDPTPPWVDVSPFD